MASTTTACSDGTVTIVNRIVTQAHTASVPATPLSWEKFYKGEPLALGITQILVGVVHFAVGMVIDMSHPFWSIVLKVYVPIWSGMLYIISGSLSVAAAKYPKIPLVKGSLGMNIISSVVAGSALVIYLVSLMENKYQRLWIWHPEEYNVTWLILAFIVVLFLFTFLEFCVSISTAAFGCKTICRDSYNEVSVVIYQNLQMPPDDPTAATSSHTDAVAYTSAPHKDLITP
uniref:Uncharacterized protein n=1 Tax=Pelusios castaneus TaxID=367368 RepID=A0A8C8S427_9SAUR